MSKGSAGVIGFDGVEIPKSMAVLRSPSNALASILGVSGNDAVSLYQAIQAGESEGFEEQILNYYRNHAKFSTWMEGIETLARLPQECLVDLLGGATYQRWQADDPTGWGRWHQGHHSQEKNMPYDGMYAGYRRLQPAYILGAD